MGTQKGKLFELAEMHRSYQSKKVKRKKPVQKKARVQVKGQHFDEEKSITLTYSLDLYPQVLIESRKNNQPVEQMSLLDDMRSEAFYVEPFEADEEIVDTSYTDAVDQYEEKLDKVIEGMWFSRSHEQDPDDDEASKALKGELKDVVDDLERKLDKVVEQKNEEVSRTPSEREPGPVEEKSPETRVKAQQLSSRTNSGDISPTPEQTDGGSGYNVSDEEFARDIGEILKGQKLYDANQKKTVDKGAPNQAGDLKTSAPKESKDDIPALKENQHKIFEQISKSMQFANAYDLGAIALDERFDQLDKEIEKEEIKQTLTDKPAENPKDEEVQYADVMEDSPFTRKQPGKKQTPLPGEQFNPGIPLDNNNGGRMIDIDLLQKGDLMLSSSGGECIASLFIGNGKVLDSSEGDSLEEKSLQQHLDSKNLVAMLRHQFMTSEKADAIVTSLTKLRMHEKGQAATLAKINVRSIGTHPDVCNAPNVTDKSKCNSFAGKIQLGTVSNDSFLCAQSFINLFESNGVGFVTQATKDHNGSLKYFGHLKNKA